MKLNILPVSVLLLLGIAGWLIYIFITKPDPKEIKQMLSDKIIESPYPERNTYDSLVNLDIKKTRTFLLKEATRSEIWDNKFPYHKNKFDGNQTERILQILNDSSTFEWGEIGTPYFDKTIVYFDRTSNIIGYTMVSFDGQTHSFPYRTLTKWGLPSDKGFRELLIAIRTE